MKEIALTRGKVAIVDDDDFKRLGQYKWCAFPAYGNWYAGRSIRSNIKNRKQEFVLMHRIIMNAEKGMQVDHKNGNGLDNRRCNIRFCSKTENQRNKRILKSNTSGYKGVYLDKRTGKWYAQINVCYKKRRLGLFDTKECAALAYNNAAKELFGEFARLNDLKLVS